MEPYKSHKIFVALVASEEADPAGKTVPECCDTEEIRSPTVTSQR
jgi:hypothetical protein